MLPSIAKLASQHSIKPLKKYGQNFIYDESLCDKIVFASGLQEGDIAVEIGPGPAGLTRSILKRKPSRLFAIETDRRCVPLLEELHVIYPNLVIIHDDAKKILIKDMAKEIGPMNNVRIISNLPYNIGTTLLIGWLKEIDVISSMTLMLQKEVVDRIIANTNTKSYGRLSVICQLICDSRKCFDVSPKAFYPPPKVWSSIVHLSPRNEIIDANVLNKVGHITNLAFSGRRKMIKSSLGKLLLSSEAMGRYGCIEGLLKRCGIDTSMRAENLAPQDYLRVAKELMVW